MSQSVVLLATAMYAASCGKSGPPNPEPDPPGATARPKPAALPPAEPIKVKTPGAAYFSVRKRGVFRFEDGAVKKVVQPPFAASQLLGHGKELVTVGIGNVYVGSKRIGPPRSTRGESFDYAARGPKGTLWFAGKEHVAAWDGKRWRIVTLASMGAKRGADGIAVDAVGTVYVLTRHGLWRGDGKVWKNITPKTITAKSDDHFVGLATDRQRKVHAFTMHEVFAIDGDTLVSRHKSRASVISRVAFRPDGALAILAGSSLTIAPSAGKPSSVSAERIGLAGHIRMSEVHVDNSSRIWLFTSVGMAVLGPDGRRLREWKWGTLEGLPGRVETMFIAGDGPVLPKQVALRKAAVTAMVLYGKDKPAKAMDIEMCPEPEGHFPVGSSPCAGKKVAFVGKTGADGRFRFENVPIGSYGIVGYNGNDWISFPDECCTRMKGPTLDLGALLTFGQVR